MGIICAKNPFTWPSDKSEHEDIKYNDNFSIFPVKKLNYFLKGNKRLAPTFL